MDKNIEISDDVVKAAQELTGGTDERAAVKAAVKRFAEASHKTSVLDGMLKLAGSDILDPDYVYKVMHEDTSIFCGQ
jgi:Arc/MetJ family transcription regulator